MYAEPSGRRRRQGPRYCNVHVVVCIMFIMCSISSSIIISIIIMMISSSSSSSIIVIIIIIIIICVHRLAPGVYRSPASRSGQDKQGFHKWSTCPYMLQYVVLNS